MFGEKGKRKRQQSDEVRGASTDSAKDAAAGLVEPIETKLAEATGKNSSRGDSRDAEIAEKKKEAIPLAIPNMNGSS